MLWRGFFAVKSLANRVGIAILTDMIVFYVEKLNKVMIGIVAAHLGLVMTHDYYTTLHTFNRTWRGSSCGNDCILNRFNE
ncbi:hypothetical protein Y032_0537g3112 [Ancylostoma ceylanicum]|uniref:Uncharacterized protein n=1 Tax=Ancylostoma ceylanicum TaxID=53326 RepID=A0A016WRN7_9BILA|nr:hypothetical protein Y032_0537g3112 [Ancylostoma ceylanicum]